MALTCLLFTSCNYSSDEIYFIDVSTEVLPTIEITSDIDTSTTYDVLDSILFKYEIVLDSGVVFFSQIYFNDDYIFLSEEMSDSLWINPADTLLINNECISQFVSRMFSWLVVISIHIYVII